MDFLGEFGVKLGIDKIIMIFKIIFIVRFSSYESRLKVIDEGWFMFDKKLIIV